jgi:hypothetical protein
MVRIEETSPDIDSSNGSKVEDMNNYNYDADYYPRPSHNCSSSNPAHDNFTFVVDSGATHHMRNT